MAFENAVDSIRGRAVVLADPQHPVGESEFRGSGSSLSARVSQWAAFARSSDVDKRQRTTVGELQDLTNGIKSVQVKPANRLGRFFSKPAVLMLLGVACVVASVALFASLPTNGIGLLAGTALLVSGVHMLAVGWSIHRAHQGQEFLAQSIHLRENLANVQNHPDRVNFFVGI